MTDDVPLPLFPLGTVLVPGLVLPLHIFEPRYRDLVADLEALPDDQRAFGVVAIREGMEIGADGVRALYDVGTIASLREITPLDGGSYDIVTVGTRRFRSRDLVEGKPYLHAHVDHIEEAEGDAAESLSQAVMRRFIAYRSLFSEEDVTELPDEPRVLSYLVAAAIVADLPMRQMLLAMPDDTERLRVELDFLRHENALISAIPSLPAIDLAHEPQSPN